MLLCGCSNTATETEPQISEISEIKESEKPVPEKSMPDPFSIPEEGLYDIRELEEGKEYIGKYHLLTSFNIPDPEYRNCQGCFFDGKTFTACLTRYADDGGQVGKICLYDLNGKVIGESEGSIRIDHANNITYIPKINSYLVSHCQGLTQEQYYMYSLVDAKTLSITKTDILEKPFFSMAYSPETDMYASAEWDGQTIDIWDGNLKLIKSVDVEMPSSLSQGVFCDKDGIYFIRSSKNGSKSEIRIYDWDAALKRTIIMDTYNESESINIIDGFVFVTTCGGNAYRISFEESA